MPKSGRGRTLGRSMSTKDMKAERDEKLRQRELAKAAGEPAVPTTGASPLARSLAAAPQPLPASVARRATAAAARTPVAAPVPAPAPAPVALPSDWDSMTKLQQIKWKRENKGGAAGSAAKQRWENAGAPSPPSRAAVCVGNARNPHAPRCGSVCLRLCVCGSADAPPWDETVAEPRRVSWSHDRDSSDSRPRPALPAQASRC